MSNRATLAAIDVDGVSKYYGPFPALQNVTFAIAPGQSAALWGPNGAGKTTIIRCLLGLTSFDGSISVAGNDPTRNGRKARQAIGYVPQDLPVQPLTVGEMATYIAKLKNADPQDAIGKLGLLGIDDQVNKEIAALSGGMRQRLSLALALIGTPSILFLDEPTANLDAKGRAELLQLLRNLKQNGMTMLFSSHRPEDVLALADTILQLDGGVLEQEQSPVGFATTLGSESRLVVFLRNGHRPVAVDTLAQMGLEAGGDGQVITVALRHDQKAEVLTKLSRNGVDIEDFEWERYAWTDMS